MQACAERAWLAQALECRQEGAMAAAVKKGLNVAVTPGAAQKLVRLAIKL